MGRLGGWGGHLFHRAVISLLLFELVSQLPSQTSRDRFADGGIPSLLGLGPTQEALACNGAVALSLSSKVIDHSRQQAMCGCRLERAKRMMLIQIKDLCHQHQSQRWTSTREEAFYPFFLFLCDQTCSFCELKHIANRATEHFLIWKLNYSP